MSKCKSQHRYNNASESKSCSVNQIGLTAVYRKCTVPLRNGSVRANEMSFIMKQNRHINM